MSEARPVGSLFVRTLLYQQMPGPRPAAGLFPTPEPVGAEGWDPVDCLQGSNRVALWLVCIGDEMDRRLRRPRLAQLPGTAVHSLARTYSRMGVRGLLRCFLRGVTRLSAHIRAWRLPCPRLWAPADRAWGPVLPAVLPAVLLLLLRGALRRLLQ
ncbi:bcl-2-interacting killer [Perognathus longimembris pacificus]|uniref:bcl-2-interacting killer n=1 Tax=Perognathus longimembris pacificus TaxID=214514 RepID=UPI00201944C9|nr:bcl-2-interacting killer [Perognathus longimembris pacificus]